MARWKILFMGKDDGDIEVVADSEAFALAAWATSAGYSARKIKRVVSVELDILTALYDCCVEGADCPPRSVLAEVEEIIEMPCGEASPRRGRE